MPHPARSLSGPCGRRGREAGKVSGEQSLGTLPRRWKAPRFSGTRHPSRGDVGTKASVGPSWRKRSPPHVPARADDRGCPLAAEEGNVVSARSQGVRTQSGRHRPRHAPGDASFTRSRDTRASSGPRPRKRARARLASITLGQTWLTLGGTERDARTTTDERVAHRASHDAHRTEVAASLPVRNTRAPWFVPVRRCYVAEVVRRRLVPNKLACLPSKKR